MSKPTLAMQSVIDHLRDGWALVADKDSAWLVRGENIRRVNRRTLDALWWGRYLGRGGNGRGLTFYSLSLEHRVARSPENTRSALP